MSEHTPTPWHVEDGPQWPWPGIEADSLSVIVIGAADEQCGVHGETVKEAQANAALIVRAVNSHDALVKALGAIAYEYANQDLNHVDFRVAAFKLATEALGAVKDAE